MHSCCIYVYLPFQIGKMGVSEIISSLSDNPYFGAGFGLFGVGAGAAIARKSAQVGISSSYNNYIIHSSYVGS